MAKIRQILCLILAWSLSQYQTGDNLETLVPCMGRLSMFASSNLGRTIREAGWRVRCHQKKTYAPMLDVICLSQVVETTGYRSGDLRDCTHRLRKRDCVLRSGTSWLKICPLPYSVAMPLVFLGTFGPGTARGGPFYEPSAVSFIIFFKQIMTVFNFK